MQKSVYKVVIVDDDPLAAHFTLNVLNERYLHQIEAEVFTKPSSVLEKLNSNSLVKNWDFDLLITDIEMPKVNGIDLIKSVKAHLPLLEFIVISGDKDVGTSLTAMDLGSIMFISKPCSPYDVWGAFELFLNQQRKSLFSHQSRGIIEAQSEAEPS